jgi:hypothetical protein
MNPDTDAEAFAELLATVGEFYDANISAARHAMYFGALLEFDFDIVRAAMNKHVATSKYFPKPADIRDLIEGTESERDANVWLSLNAAIRRVGVWQSVIIEDPYLADAIIRIWGSWVACCEFAARADQILWNSKRKDLTAAYRIAQKMIPKGRGPIMLAGHCEMENRQSGFFPKRAYYGAIMVDGRVETRYLGVAPETGLPALPLADALALPPVVPRLALRPATEAEAAPAGETGQELDANAARRSFEDALSAIIKNKGFPAAPKPGAWTPADDDRRREELKAQGRIINAEAIISEPAEATAEPLRAEEAAPAGQSDRASDPRSAPAEAGDGVPVRDDSGPTVGSGLRMAGVPDPVRGRGGSVRKRGPRRAGSSSAQRPR